MSGSAVEALDSTSSSISHFSLQDPPRVKNPRRNSLPTLLRNRNHPKAVILQAPSINSLSDLRNSELQSILINDWVKMKIEVPKIYLGILYANMLASLFTWLLLAGFIVLPVTFASLRNSHALDSIGKAGKAVFGTVQNVPFLWIAGTLFVCGAIGLSWLWWENRNNYIWLTDRIFLPALLHSIVGLITTLINVYSTQGGQWSVTAVVTAAVTAFITLVTLVLYMLYIAWAEPAWEEHCAMNGYSVASR